MSEHERKPTAADLDPERWLTVVPAYGRDYVTATQALADWQEGKDFRIMDIGCAWDGCYTSTRDHGPAVTVKIRYNRLADFVLVRGNAAVPGGVSDDQSTTTPEGE